MQAWKSIQKARDYIDMPYDTNITLQELAEQAYFSLFYFQRLCSRLVGKIVFEYMKQ